MLDRGANPDGPGSDFAVLDFFHVGAELRSMGYDGTGCARMMATSTTPLRCSIPSQIKSATDNSGAFRTGKNTTATNEWVAIGY
jgi:hypothetical protein